MSVEIVTDVNVLHEVSKPVVGKPSLKLIGDLCEYVLNKGLGIAAPQLGVFERVFLAKLSCGKLLFINPKIYSKSPEKVPSKEGCFSFPGIEKTVERHHWVRISADIVQKFDNDGSCVESLNADFRLKGLDAFIVQHENDHLDGIVLTDLPEVLSREDRIQNNIQKRAQKLSQKRHAKRNQKPTIQRMNPKKQAELDARIKIEKKRELKRIRLDEEEKFLQSSLSVSSTPYHEPENILPMIDDSVLNSETEDKV